MTVFVTFFGSIYGNWPLLVLAASRYWKKADLLGDIIGNLGRKWYRICFYKHLSLCTFYVICFSEHKRCMEALEVVNLYLGSFFTTLFHPRKESLFLFSEYSIITSNQASAFAYAYLGFSWSYVSWAMFLLLCRLRGVHIDIYAIDLVSVYNKHSSYAARENRA